MQKTICLQRMRDLARREVLEMPLVVQEFIRTQEAHSSGKRLLETTHLEPTAFYGYMAVPVDARGARSELYLTPPAAFYRFGGLDDILEAYFPRLPAGLRQQLNFLLNHQICEVHAQGRYLVRSLPFGACCA